jgi:hypothetical protein
MAQEVTYEGWEPVFVKVLGAFCIWRLDYHGIGEWSLHCRKHVWKGITRWSEVKRGGINALTQWARTVQFRQYDGSVPRRMGILISGSYEKRLLKLRETLIVIGWEQRYTTEGGIGTSFVSCSDFTLYAELGNAGGVDIWGRCSERFVGGTNFSIAEDCSSMEEIIAAIDNAGYSSDLINIDQLHNLLMTSWTTFRS